MNSTICNNCRLVLRRTLRASLKCQQQRAHESTMILTSRAQGSQQSAATNPNTNTSYSELASLLSKPSWSVRSLLPPSTSTSTSTSASTSTSTPSITPQTLHHLLRLSALPKPQTPEEEAQMLATLSSQLHFVRAIQGVDTADVAPLHAIRDETAQGLREQTIGLAGLREALDAEDIVGHARRPRRRRSETRQMRNPNSDVLEEGGTITGTDAAREQRSAQKQKTVPSEEENWDVLAGASETAGGRYFVVRSSGAGALPNVTVG